MRSAPASAKASIWGVVRGGVVGVDGFAGDVAVDRGGRGSR